MGCGTGRHWKKILENEPEKLIGFDVSVRNVKNVAAKISTGRNTPVNK